VSVSRRGVRFIAKFEGFRSCPYDDGAGTWTIGYGTISHDGHRVTSSTPCISKRTARKWLRADLERSYDAHKLLPSHLDLHQYEVDALSSLAYNEGPGVLTDGSFSTLARRLHTSEAHAYSDRRAIYRQEIPKWNRADGRPWPGLVTRRAAEVRLATTGKYS
jgi:lysozyme